MVVIEKSVKEFKDVGKFQKYLKKRYISKWIIATLREMYREKIKNELKEEEERAKQKKPITIKGVPEKKLPKCKKEWPTCSVVIASKSKIKRSSSFMVLQSSLDPPNLIQNYFTSANFINTAVKKDRKPVPGPSPWSSSTIHEKSKVSLNEAIADAAHKSL